MCERRKDSSNLDSRGMVHQLPLHFSNKDRTGFRPWKLQASGRGGLKLVAGSNSSRARSVRGWVYGIILAGYGIVISEITDGLDLAGQRVVWPCNDL
jgi:hypothetical protein